jgi:hypothetical protein
VDVPDFAGDLVDAVDVNAKALLGRQGFAREFQQDALECNSQRRVLGDGFACTICILSQESNSDVKTGIRKPDAEHRVLLTRVPVNLPISRLPGQRAW